LAYTTLDRLYAVFFYIIEVNHWAKVANTTANINVDDIAQQYIDT